MARGGDSGRYRLENGLRFFPGASAVAAGPGGTSQPAVRCDVYPSTG